MAKTKRDLLYALADKIGGDHARRMREALERSGPLDEALDRPIGDREYVVELASLERDFRAALAKKKRIDWDIPGSWDSPN